MRIDRNNRKLIVRAFQEDAPRGDLTARFFSEKKTVATAKLSPNKLALLLAYLLL